MAAIAERRPAARESGTAMVEACVVAAFAVPAIAGLLGVCYFVFARAWTQHWAYEAAICVARGEAEASCGRRLRDALEAALPIGEVRVARAWREGAGARGAARAEAVFEASPCRPDSLCVRSRADRRVALPLTSPRTGSAP